jgi:transposase
MRPPALIQPWLTVEELMVWVREAPTRDAYKMRLAVWLTHIGYHAYEVSDMLQVSKQAVWLWTAQYNKHGPESLKRKGRGGRRWYYLSLSQEDALLQGFREYALRGEVLTAKQIFPEVRKAVGREVSIDYVYRLLRRHKWRKLGPRPRHVKSDKSAQEEFKKTTRLSSRKR